MTSLRRQTYFTCAQLHSALAQAHRTLLQVNITRSPCVGCCHPCLQPRAHARLPNTLRRCSAPRPWPAACSDSASASSVTGGWYAWNATPRQQTSDLSQLQGAVVVGREKGAQACKHFAPSLPPDMCLADTAVSAANKLTASILAENTDAQWFTCAEALPTSVRSVLPVTGWLLENCKQRDCIDSSRKHRRPVVHLRRRGAHFSSQLCCQ